MNRPSDDEQRKLWQSRNQVRKKTRIKTIKHHTDVKPEEYDDNPNKELLEDKIQRFLVERWGIYWRKWGRWHEELDQQFWWHKTLIVLYSHKMWFFVT